MVEAEEGLVRRAEPGTGESLVAEASDLERGEVVEVKVEEVEE